PDRPQHEPEAAEEVERPVAVAADERDRQQVEEAADVPLDAVARAAVLPRAMVDGELGGAEAAVVREHRDETVKLAVKAHPVYDLGAVGLEAAVHVVEAEARDAAGHPVEDSRGNTPPERVSTTRLPAGDEVVALVELGEQAGDLSRVVLEIAVDRDDGLAACVVEACCKCRRLPEVSPQADHADVVVPGVEPRQGGEGAVGRAVVDEDRLPLLSQRLEGRLELVVEERDGALLVVQGNDDRDHGARRLAYAARGGSPVDCRSA